MTVPEAAPAVRPRLRAGLRIFLALIYLVVGLAHLRSAEGFLAIMPSWVPFPLEVIRLTGVCEILGAIGLMVPRLRWLAGVMLALYAMGVYPANLHHAFGEVSATGLPTSWWYHGPRLAFQPVFVWWALFAGGVINWPFKVRTS